MVLVAHDRTKDLEANWYMGRIKLYGVSEAWKKFSGNPMSNFMIKYTKKQTGNALEGDEAAELTSVNYGPGVNGGCCLSQLRRESSCF